MLKFVGSEKYLIAFLAACILILTAFVVFLYSDRFLRPQLFKDEEFRMDPSFVEKWTEMYSRHVGVESEKSPEVVDGLDDQINREVNRLKFGSFYVKRE